MPDVRDGIEAPACTGIDCNTLAESRAAASPNWSATMRWMDWRRSVVGAGDDVLVKQTASRCRRAGRGCLARGRIVLRASSARPQGGLQKVLL